MLEGKISTTISSLIKFLAMVHIIICHFNHDFPFSSTFQGFIFPGCISVSIFFFLSAYGLSESIGNKKIEIQRFLFIRIFRVLKPLLLIGSVFLFLFILVKIDNQIIKNVVIGIYSNWFVQVIIIFYLLFIISVNVSQLRIVQCLTLTILTLVYVIIAFIVLKLPSTYVNAIFTFPLGLIYSLYRKDIVGKMKAIYYVVLLIIIFAILYLIYNLHYLIFKEIGFTLIVNILLIIPMVNISNSGVFRINYIKQFCLFLGLISYEMYLVHPYLLEYCKYKNYPNVYFIPFLVIVILISYIFNTLSNKINT